MINVHRPTIRSLATRRKRRAVNETLCGHGRESMNPEWQIRPYETPAFVQDVVSPHPRAGIIVIGDNAILHLKDEPGEDVCVRVTQTGPDGRMLGVISRANRIGARGDGRLAKGASVEFEEKHVFRLEKAT